MHYKPLTVLIFVLLVLMVALLFIYPSPFIIWLSIIGLPVLIAFQAWIVLRAKDESQYDSDDEKWYEDRHN